MEELIDLLKAVLDTHQSRNVANQLQALVSEIESVRLMMQTYAESIERLFPSALAIERLVADHDRMATLMEQVARDTRWTRAQLDAEVDGSI